MAAPRVPSEKKKLFGKIYRPGTLREKFLTIRRMKCFCCDPDVDYNRKQNPRYKSLYNIVHGGRKWTDENVDLMVRTLCGEKTLQKVKTFPGTDLCRSCLKRMKNAYRFVTNIQNNANESFRVRPGQKSLALLQKQEQQRRSRRLEQKNVSRSVDDVDTDQDSPPRSMSQSPSQRFVIQPETEPSSIKRDRNFHAKFRQQKYSDGLLSNSFTAVDPELSVQAASSQVQENVAQVSTSVLLTYKATDDESEHSDTYTFTDMTGNPDDEPEASEGNLADGRFMQEMTKRSFLEGLKALAKRANIAPGEEAVFQIQQDMNYIEDFRLQVDLVLLNGVPI